MNMLKISEAASLALHSMTMIARQKECLSNVDAAKKLCASSNTLSKVLQRLAHAGLIKSVRGPHGGYTLAKNKSDIKLIEIYEAVEGPIGEPGCLLSSPACSGVCVLGGLVESVHGQVKIYLNENTLEDLAGRVIL